MARAIEQIERDLAALEEAIGAIAAELRRAYASYLKALGQAMQQHLILASYQLCTQGYPEVFLSLSVSQRQQLQQAIRQLGQKTADELLVLLRAEESGRWGNRETEGEEENNALHAASAPSPQSFDASCYSGGDSYGYSPESGEPAHGDVLRNALAPPRSSNPQQLALWQQNIEEAIASSLKTVSREANLLLQQAGILPKKLTPPLLEAAATASEASAEMVAGPPNLLNLLVEAENQEQPEDPNVTPIIAIHLRLTEIEFADATVRAGRNQIRNIETQVRSCLREYQKKQRERTVAEAEAAWRLSWFDE